MSTIKGFGTTTPWPYNPAALSNKTDWNLIQYRVDFKPDEERTFLRKMLVLAVHEQLPKYIFDGSIMWTWQPLNDDKSPVVLTTRRKSDDTHFQITIREVDEVLPTDHHYEQVLNNVEKQCIEKLNLQLLSSDDYDQAAAKMLKDFKLELLSGYLTSIRQTHENNIQLCCEFEDVKAVVGCSSKFKAFMKKQWNRFKRMVGRLRPNADLEKTREKDGNEMYPERTEEDWEYINVKVVDQHPQEIQFKVKQTTQMKKLKESYSGKVGIPGKMLSFFFNGRRIKDDDTPTVAALKMKQDDYIEVFQE